MKHRLSSSLSLIAVASLACGALAHAADQPPAAPAVDLLETTCADYLTGLKLADPGENPSAEATAAAQEVQDDIVNALMWMHGYQTGRAPQGQPVPLTKEWLTAEVGKLAEACRAQSPDGSMTLVTVAGKR